MNILYIIKDFNHACGVSNYVYLLLKELKNIKEVNLFFVTTHGDASLDRIATLNIRVDYIENIKGNYNPFRFLKGFQLLKKYCTENNIEIIHTNHRYEELISFFVGKLLSIKTVTTVHSIVKEWYYFSYKSNVLIAVSKAVEKNLIEGFKISAEKIIQLYNYVHTFQRPTETAINKLKEDYGIVKNEIILLFVGRINLVKGIDVLLEAFKKINKDKFFLKLLVIGEFSDEKLKLQILNNPKIVYVTPRSGIEEFYFLSDIIVAPSRIDPFPFVMLEAGLAKKPFIGGRTGGIEEFVEDGIDGLLVEPGNAEDLYNKIINLFNDEELRKKLGENLNNKVSKLNSPSEYCGKIINIYKDLLGVSRT
jgi:glycosyltransferase involved in cell wall biosynthesis